MRDTAAQKNGSRRGGRPAKGYTMADPREPQATQAGEKVVPDAPQTIDEIPSATRGEYVPARVEL